MRNTKMDRRSERTRGLLSAALLDLMLQKRYDDITVQDIIDRANVGRSTFYAHYLDKDDLLVSDFTRAIDALTEHMRAPPGPGSGAPPAGLAPFFAHVRAHQPLYQALVRGGGIDLLFRKGHERLRQHIERQLAALVPVGRAPAAPLELVADYMAGAVLTMLTWWLDHGAAASPEEMDGLYHRLVLPGVMTTLDVPLAVVAAPVPPHQG